MGMNIEMHVFILLWMFKPVCMCACIFVCLYVYIHLCMDVPASSCWHVYVSIYKIHLGMLA